MRARQRGCWGSERVSALWLRLTLWWMWLLVAPDVVAQGRPDIQWMVGGHTIAVSAVAFSPDGQYIASAGSFDGTVKIWRVADGQLVRTIANPIRFMRLPFRPMDSFW